MNADAACPYCGRMVALAEMKPHVAECRRKYIQAAMEQSARLSLGGGGVTRARVTLVPRARQNSTKNYLDSPPKQPQASSTPHRRQNTAPYTSRSPPEPEAAAAGSTAHAARLEETDEEIVLSPCENVSGIHRTASVAHSANSSRIVEATPAATQESSRASAPNRSPAPPTTTGDNSFASDASRSQSGRARVWRPAAVQTTSSPSVAARETLAPRESALARDKALRNSAEAASPTARPSPALVDHLLLTIRELRENLREEKEARLEAERRAQEQQRVLETKVSDARESLEEQVRALTERVRVLEQRSSATEAASQQLTGSAPHTNPASYSDIRPENSALRGSSFQNRQVPTPASFSSFAAMDDHTLPRDQDMSGLRPLMSSVSAPSPASIPAASEPPHLAMHDILSVLRRTPVVSLKSLDAAQHQP